MNEPSPIEFADLGVSESLVSALAIAGFNRPMPVQADCMIPALAGRDLVVQSRTGSGKTLAFVVPTLQRLRFNDLKTQVLVLAPTRELAKQVHDVFTAVGAPLGLKSVCIYGGTRYNEQLDSLHDGVQIVVGTPGRILDHFRRNTLHLHDIETLILDEADEMLSAGFFEDIRKIIDACRPLDHVLLFSATLPPNIEGLIQRHMKDPVHVNLSSDRVDVDRIENVAYDIGNSGTRLRALLSVLEAEDPRAAIIFCNTKADTESVTAYLQRRGFDAALLNSNLSQTARETVMDRMKSGNQRLLVATDIAARGIDISFLPCVIHYELPEDTQQYIHRTGRTGRFDRTGRAISLVDTRDKHLIARLDWDYGIKLSVEDTPTRQETLKMLSDRRIRELKERIETNPVIPEEFSVIAKDILDDAEAATLVALLIDNYLAAPKNEDCGDKTEAKPRNMQDEDSAFKSRPSRPSSSSNNNRGRPFKRR